MDKPSMFEQARSLAAGEKTIINSEGISHNGATKLSQFINFIITY